MSDMGRLHVYTGEGKGKTTAAVGLSVRAVGSGKRVVFAQFMKGAATGELAGMQRCPAIELFRCEEAFPFYGKMDEEEKKRQTRCHNKILEQALARVEAACDMVILDEVTYACRWALLDEALLKRLLDTARGRTEVVCTGRDAPRWLLDRADYITEMQSVRHPFEKGVRAREGIEY